MGKKDKTGLGRCLIKDRFSKRGHRKNNSMLHTADLDDGYDWNRINLRSITEESSFQEFLSTATLAGTEFTAEKLNHHLVQPTKNIAAPPPVPDEVRKMLKIPRRPVWSGEMTAEELRHLESESFLAWRRSFAEYEKTALTTPFEKNLDFWRQLWRVVERSDVVVQILDARNPLLFRCEDLESYVKEVNAKKKNVLLINKADFLTEAQRRIWHDYFEKEGIDSVFYSAVQEDTDLTMNDLKIQRNKWDLLTRAQLIDVLESYGEATIGFVGYPNVGKSSTINSLLNAKKVSVSATPGKTKHFQTHCLTKTLVLCDCPGLVFPSIVSTKAEMVLNGILPVDQLRDHGPSIAMVCSLVPKHFLEDKYSIMIPEREGNPNKFDPEEFLSSFAFSRGFMTQNGQPDRSRTARAVLKDVVNGRLIYCVAPPGQEQAEFHKFPPRSKEPPVPTPRAARAVALTDVPEDMDRTFFSKMVPKAHERTAATGLSATPANNSKPWKDHSAKRNKREKLRRVYSHHDNV